MKGSMKDEWPIDSIKPSDFNIFMKESFIDKCRIWNMNKWIKIEWVNMSKEWMSKYIFKV